jgi:PAS domain S-box-containing protein
MTAELHDTFLESDIYCALTRYATDLAWVVGKDGTTRYVSPSAARVLEHDPKDVVGHAFLELVHPEDRNVVRSAFEALRAGAEGPVPVHLRYRRGDGSWRILEAVLSADLDNPAVAGFIVNARDVAERVLARAEMSADEAAYRNVFEATLESLVINDLAGRIVEINSAARDLYGYDTDELIGQQLAMLVHPDWRERMMAQLQGIADGPVQFDGMIVRKDGASRSIEGRATIFSYRGTPHMLSMARDVTERVRAYELLEQRVDERTRELSTLLDVSRNVASTLELQPLLDLILDQLKMVVDYTGAGITVADGDEVRIVGYQGPGPQAVALGSRLPVSRIGPLWALMQKAEPVIIEDVRANTPAARVYRETVGTALETDFAYVSTWMTVPMRSKERYIGSLFLEHGERGAYSARHAELALAIAQQAAIAIENARLYEQAQELATLEERARLARELHDSVTQALFSMTLHTRAAQMLLAQRQAEPDRALAETVDRLAGLTQGALAEMRALIFELRPGALREEGLTAALQKHAAAVSAREDLAIDVRAPDERLTLPEAVETHLFRLTQEAIHNAVKHASATRVVIRAGPVDGEPGALLLEIEDDGVGFDTTLPRPGHMGLRTMRERVRQIGGRFEIVSGAGHGTAVRVVVQGVPGPGV